MQHLAQVHGQVSVVDEGGHGAEHLGCRGGGSGGPGQLVRPQGVGLQEQNHAEQPASRWGRAPGWTADLTCTERDEALVGLWVREGLNMLRKPVFFRWGAPAAPRLPAPDAELARGGAGPILLVQMDAIGTFGRGITRWVVRGPDEGATPTQRRDDSSGCKHARGGHYRFVQYSRKD